MIVVKKNIHIHELKSPEREQYHLLLIIIGKCPLYFHLEDYFTHFENGKHHMGNAIKFTGDYQYFNEQLASIKMIEQATKVRAMRYFFAKRKF